MLVGRSRHDSLAPDHQIDAFLSKQLEGQVHVTIHRALLSVGGRQRLPAPLNEPNPHGRARIALTLVQPPEAPGTTEQQAQRVARKPGTPRVHRSPSPADTFASGTSKHGNDERQAIRAPQCDRLNEGVTGGKNDPNGPGQQARPKRIGRDEQRTEYQRARTRRYTQEPPGRAGKAEAQAVEYCERRPRCQSDAGERREPIERWRDPTAREQNGEHERQPREEQHLPAIGCRAQRYHQGRQGHQAEPPKWVDCCGGEGRTREHAQPTANISSYAWSRGRRRCRTHGPAVIACD